MEEIEYRKQEKGDENKRKRARNVQVMIMIETKGDPVHRRCQIYMN